MAAALSSALKAFSSAKQMGGAARSLMPDGMNIARQGLKQGLPEAMQKLGKSAPGFSGALSAMSRAAPHLDNLLKKPGPSGIVSGMKALRELRGATRELSKSMASASGSGKSGGGFKVMVGRPQKNWEEATPEKGFRELGSGKDGAKTPGFKVMVGRPQKNWEMATKENGFRELPAKGSSSNSTGERAHGVRIMIGRPQKNWEEATAANGFRELGGRKSSADGKGSGSRHDFRIIIGRSGGGKEKDAESDGQKGSGLHIQISFARQQSSGMAKLRVGGLDIAMHGSSSAPESRKRAHSFDEGTQRKGASGGFTSLAMHESAQTRRRAKSI